MWMSLRLSWRYIAPRPFEENLMRFGQRRAMAARVLLRAGADYACCHVEAVARGWLFLIPSGPKDCWLLVLARRSKNCSKTAFWWLRKLPDWGKVRPDLKPPAATGAPCRAGLAGLRHVGHRV
jgi:hypothetical protein